MFRCGSARAGKERIPLSSGVFADASVRGAAAGQCPAVADPAQTSQAMIRVSATWTIGHENDGYAQHRPARQINCPDCVPQRVWSGLIQYGLIRQSTERSSRPRHQLVSRPSASGVAYAQLRLDALVVRGCSRLPLAVADCRRCRHGCRQRYELTFRSQGGESSSRHHSPRRVFHTRCAGPGLFVPKLGCGSGCRRRSRHGLRQAVRTCPLASTTIRGDCHSVARGRPRARERQWCQRVTA